jgi:polysaccharide chain length determinant protein (PEP-CTERM system associated)
LDQGLDLRFCLSVLRRRLLVMLLAFAALAGAAFAVAVLLPPVFQSQAKIIVESQQIPADLVRSTVTGLADERLQVIEQRITTRDVLLGLVEKFDLFPDERARLTPTELVELMRERIAIERFDLGSVGRRGRPDALTIGFTVGFEDRSPQVAARVANELVTLILAEDVKSRTARASETTRFLEREADRRRKELVVLEAQISAYKLENDSALPEKLPFLMSQLERAKNELATLDREIYATHEQQRLMELELNIRRAGLGGGSGSPASATQQQLEALNLELARKRSVYTDTHPDIQSLRRQIASLEEQGSAIAASAETIEPSSAANFALDVTTRLLSEKIDSLKARRANLQGKYDAVSEVIEGLSQLIVRVPEVQVHLGNLERRHENMRTSLEELSSKLDEAKLGERLELDKQAERFEVLEQPITPTEPTRPNRPVILLGGLGLAAGAALGIALLLEMLNRTVRSAADVARIMGQPPLATIPYMTTTGEIRRARARMMLALLMALMIVAAALLAIHFAYMPLDEVAFKVLARFGI